MPSEGAAASLRVGRDAGWRPATLARRAADQGEARVLLEKGWRRCRRRRAVAELLFLLFATIATSIVGLSVTLHRSETERSRAIAARRDADLNLEAATGALDQLIQIIGGALFARAMHFQPTTLKCFFKRLATEEHKVMSRSASPSSTNDLSFAW